MDTNFTKSVLTFYYEMVKNGISLVYLGEFNHEITKMFTSMAEADMIKQKEEKRTQKKVYHVMVETLQNMNKHSDSLSNSDIGEGLFVIGRKGENYYVITANKVAKDKVPKLKEMIEEINHASKEELKDMYMTQIRDGKISDKGGAGLGLIDIARKSGEKYQYQFIPLDKDNYFFMLKVKVKAK